MTSRVSRISGFCAGPADGFAAGVEGAFGMEARLSLIRGSGRLPLPSPFLAAAPSAVRPPRSSERMLPPRLPSRRAGAADPGRLGTTRAPELLTPIRPAIRLAMPPGRGGADESPPPPDLAPDAGPPDAGVPDAGVLAAGAPVAGVPEPGGRPVPRDLADNGPDADRERRCCSAAAFSANASAPPGIAPSGMSGR